jgi:protein-S-isoprenylcysteine O-methyltransferase Ste14
MLRPLEWLLFIGLTVIAVIASLHAWRQKLRYGLYRFIAFEFLAVLVAVNADHWFWKPLAARQLASWALLLLATALAAHGILLLRVVGHARRRVMEDTLVLVEVGAYRYIRHPLYLALMLFAWGVFLKGFDLASCALAVIITGFLAATSRSEEQFNAEQLGASYSEYTKRTKMFVPFLF